MSDYKRQTREVYSKGRVAYDPSKKLFEESRSIAQRDKAFISDMEKVSKDYSTALDSWNKNLTELGKEEAEFFKTVTPTLSKFLGEDLVKIQKIQVEASDDKIVYDFSQKSQEEQNSIRRGYEATFAQIGENRGKRTDLEAQAREIYEKTGSEDALAFAEYLSAHNKRQDTSIFKMLMNENLQNFDNTLTEAFQQSEKIYTDRTTGEKFAGNEANTQERVATVIDEEHQKFYRATQVGGINTGIIAAFSEETLNQKANLVRAAELKKINIREAKENITNIGGEIRSVLGISNLTVNTEKELQFHLIDGEINPEIKQTLTTALTRLEQEAYNANYENPQEFAYKELAKILREIAGDDQAKIDFFDKVLGVYGSEHPDAILLSHSDGRGDVTFGELNQLGAQYFGGNGRPGSWAGTNRENSSGNTNTASTGTGAESGGNGSPAFEKNWHVNKWIPEDGKGTPLEPKDGLYDLTDTRWQGTYQWELVSMHLDGASSDQITARLEEIAEEAKLKGANTNMINTILNWNPPTTKEQLQAHLKSNASELVVGGEIKISSLEGFFVNKRDMNEWLKENFKEGDPLYGVRIVDEYSQSADEVSTAESTVYRIINSLDTTNSGWTAGKEAILDDIVAKARAVSNSNPDVSFQDAIETELDLYRRVQAEKMTSHQWYQNQNNGGHFNYEGHKGQWNNPDRYEDFKNDVDEARERREAMVLKGENPFNKEELTSIAEEYTKTGNLSIEFLTTAANAIANSDNNVSIITYLNNALKQHPELAEKYGTLELSSDLEETLKAFPPHKLNTLYKLTQNNGGLSSSNNLDIAASRIISTEINNDLKKKVGIFGEGWGNFFNPLGVKVEDSRPIMPSQPSLLKTFEAAFNNGAGDTSAKITNSNGIIQYGKYGINGVDAKRVYKIVTGNEFNEKDFLNNTNDIQTTIAKHLISELTTQQVDREVRSAKAFISGYSTTGEVYDNKMYGGSVSTRNIIHGWLNGYNPNDKNFTIYPRLNDGDYEMRMKGIGTENLRINNNYLLQYDNYNVGGVVHSW